MEHLEQCLAHLPRKPGVYLMKDRQGRILYVGKAKRLDLRVRSYFGAGGSVHPKQAALVPQIADIETIITHSDVEALLLEMTLIKEKRPPYNIRLKDDKRFPYLKMTLGEPYPKPVITRRTPRDGSRYFGPYTDAGALRRTLKMIRTLFPIRSCMGERPGRGPQYRECLDFHIHRCAAPCIGKISQTDYRVQVDRLVQFLAGQGNEVMDAMRADMISAAEARDFERAAVLRDRIRGVERLMRRQKMHDSQDRAADVFAFVRDGDTAYGTVLQVRGGNVLGKERRKLRGTGEASDEAVMCAFLGQFYRERDDAPREVILAVQPDGMETLETWLSTRASHPVKLHVPQRGRLHGLTRLAEENARLDLETARGKTGGGLAPELYALQTALGLTSPPSHIEGFDISNIQGTHPVASLVVFENGKPAKGSYRRYHMRGFDGADDFAMMAQAVGRRAARIASGEFGVPDLFLIDGGQGQVNAACTALEQEGLSDVTVVGLAKREELLILPGREPVRLARSHDGLKLLIRVRDEAHRFALAFHRTQRSKAALASPLDRIPGIGHKRKVLLLKSLGSLEAIVAADLSTLAEIPGIGQEVARRIVEHLHREDEVPGAA